AGGWGGGDRRSGGGRRAHRAGLRRARFRCSVAAEVGIVPCRSERRGWQGVGRERPVAAGALARVERSKTRDPLCRADRRFPDFASLNPGFDPYGGAEFLVFELRAERHCPNQKPPALGHPPKPASWWSLTSSSNSPRPMGR